MYFGDSRFILIETCALLVTFVSFTYRYFAQRCTPRARRYRGNASPAARVRECSFGKIRRNVVHELPSNRAPSLLFIRQPRRALARGYNISRRLLSRGCRVSRRQRVFPASCQRENTLSGQMGAHSPANIDTKNSNERIIGRESRRTRFRALKHRHGRSTRALRPIVPALHPPACPL